MIGQDWIGRRSDGAGLAEAERLSFLGTASLSNLLIPRSLYWSDGDGGAILLKDLQGARPAADRDTLSGFLRWFTVGRESAG